MAPKMPAPITAPMPSMIKSPAPSARFRAYGLAPSTSSSEIGLRRKSCLALDKERRQHQRERAQEFYEYVQRRPLRFLDRPPPRAAPPRRFGGRPPLPAVLTGLDELLGVVPGPAAVIEQGGHENAADRAHHQERRHRLRADVE